MLNAYIKNHPLVYRSTTTFRLIPLSVLQYFFIRTFIRWNSFFSIQWYGTTGHCSRRSDLCCLSFYSLPVIVTQRPVGRMSCWIHGHLHIAELTPRRSSRSRSKTRGPGLPRDSFTRTQAVGLWSRFFSRVSTVPTKISSLSRNTSHTPPRLTIYSPASS